MGKYLRKIIVILISIFFLSFSIILLLQSWKHSLIIQERSVSEDRNTEIAALANNYYDLQSGNAVGLPWEKDLAFLEALASKNTFLQMAAYRTVLPDPLPGEEYNVHLAARLLSGTVLEAGEIFSHNKVLGPYTSQKGYRAGPTYAGTRMTTTIGGGVCKIASTLYNVAVLSNLEIIERHPHSMPVPYVPYGQDATVAYGIKDFKFKNNTPYPILIWAQGINNTLYIGFYGQVKPPKVKWHHDVIKLVERGALYRHDANLPEGCERIVVKGMDGGLVESWLTIRQEDGSYERKKLGRYYYAPINDVIDKGIGQY